MITLPRWCPCSFFRRQLFYRGNKNVGAPQGSHFQRLPAEEVKQYYVRSCVFFYYAHASGEEKAPMKLTVWNRQWQISHEIFLEEYVAIFLANYILVGSSIFSFSYARQTKRIFSFIFTRFWEITKWFWQAFTWRL